MAETFDTLFARMTETYTQLTGALPDDASDIGIRMRVLAQELGSLYKTLTQLEGQLFPADSTGEYLDRHAGSRGLERKGAVAATGILEFGRTTPATEDIPLPEGLVCATAGEPSVRFITTQEGVLAAGETQVRLAAQAQTGGPNGNAATGRVTVMLTPAAGIGAVNNPTPFTGGEEEESDDSLRERLLASYRMVSNGTNAAYYRRVAQSFEGITSAKVIPRAQGVGTVEVVVTNGGSAPAPAVMEALEATLTEEKEINVDVTVTAAQPKPVNLQLTATVPAGGDVQGMQTRLEQRLPQWMATLPVGEPLRLAAVYPVAMALGLENLTIQSPTADVLPTQRQVVTPGTVTILCEEAVE